MFWDVRPPLEYSFWFLDCRKQNAPIHRRDQDSHAYTHVVIDPIDREEDRSRLSQVESWTYLRLDADNCGHEEMKEQRKEPQMSKSVPKTKETSEILPIDNR